MPLDHLSPAAAASRFVLPSRAPPLQAVVDYSPYDKRCLGEGASAADLWKCQKAARKSHRPLLEGLYAGQIGRWLRAFDASQVRVCVFLAITIHWYLHLVFLFLVTVRRNNVLRASFKTAHTRSQPLEPLLILSGRGRGGGWRRGEGCSAKRRHIFSGAKPSKLRFYRYTR